MIFEDLDNARETFLHPENVLGCDPVEYLTGIKADIQEFILPIAESLDSIAIGAGATKIADGSLGVLGGGLAVAGIATAPLTLGTSLILTGVGIGVGFAGAATSIGAKTAKIVMDKKKIGESKKVFDKIIAKLKVLEEIMRDYSTALAKAQNYLNLEMQGIADDKRMELVGKYVLCYAKYAQALTFDLANDAVVVGGRVLATSSGKVAVAFGAVGAALGIGLGIWDIVAGARDIYAVRAAAEGTGGDKKDQAKKTADKIRQKAMEMVKNVDEMLVAYQDELDNLGGNVTHIFESTFKHCNYLPQLLGKYFEGNWPKGPLISTPRAKKPY